MGNMFTKQVPFGTATLSTTKVVLFSGVGRIVGLTIVGGAALEEITFGDRKGTSIFGAPVLVPASSTVYLPPFDALDGLSAVTTSAAGDVGVYGIARVDEG